MKKLLLALAVLAASTGLAQAGTVYKQCRAGMIQQDGSLRQTPGQFGIIADDNDQFSFYIYDVNNAEAIPAINASPVLDHKLSNVRFGDNAAGRFVKAKNGNYAFVIGPGTTLAFDMCQPLKEDSDYSQPFLAELYDGDHGSEFAERGDIARPENAGANMFTGDLYDEKGDFVKKVVLIRAANNDITLVINDGDKKLYKKDDDMTGKPGTYSEPRLAIQFSIAEGRTYEVKHTVLVK